MAEFRNDARYDRDSVDHAPSEADLVGDGTPTEYIIDDAKVLNRTTRSELGSRLKSLEEATGYRLEVATVRKLEVEPDAFALGDKLLGKWYGQPDKQGILLIVTTGKDGALTGGPAFVKAVGEDLVDSVVGENIPILTEQEKYNATVLSSVERIAARLEGKEVPAAPQRADTERRRTYKTKAETEQKKPVTSTIVLTLLAISFVVPMLQYFGYTNKD
ncbi:UPF0603 protein, chloroplastic [Auxenochlorella protothecoides]|uniref:UPF0603 protein, chloroplastic n=1 Tax=Auxenochlorella protothecoides TaxID=3075 RepID=A0A087SI87_AUXPR|nr:UPF0603 protein, chloroplastic [Auxenochlorella protothecoides]KFM25441.1 UPF0603 protein, chloroplastic [Auxenochlorella protothecoides]